MTARKPPATARPHGASTGDIRVRLYRNPLRLAASASTWRSAWFLLGYLVIGWLLFGAVLAAVTATASLVITLAGLPLLIVTVAVVRGCANAERRRMRIMLTGPLRGGYRSVQQPGALPGRDHAADLVLGAGAHVCRVLRRPAAPWRSVRLFPAWAIRARGRRPLCGHLA
jgi:hypothetical protein